MASWPPVATGLRQQEPLAREGVGWHVFEHLADCEVVDSKAIRRMTPEQRMVFAFNMLRQEVNNGGFEAYFRYQGGDTATYAIEGARRIAGARWSTLIEEACRTMGSSYPADVETREHVVDRLAGGRELLSRLDDRLRRLEKVEPADDRIDNFVWSNGSAFFV